MSIVTIIPARMGSSRFPGKPLASIAGRPMIERIYNNAASSILSEHTYIATCDNEIQLYAYKIGAKCIMTSSQHERCSDRVAEAIEHLESSCKISAELIVMVQGDEPLVSGEDIDNVIRSFKDAPDASIVNLMAKIHTEEEFISPHTVKVVTDIYGNALYFSREPIPSSKLVNELNAYKQTGIIAFNKDSLSKFNETTPSTLERLESVDMLRIIENGGKVKMVVTSNNLIAVDIPSDIRRVQDVLMNLTV